MWAPSINDPRSWEVKTGAADQLGLCSKTFSKKLFFPLRESEQRKRLTRANVGGGGGAGGGGTGILDS